MCPTLIKDTHDKLWMMVMLGTRPRHVYMISHPLPSANVLHGDASGEESCDGCGEEFYCFEVFGWLCHMVWLQIPILLVLWMYCLGTHE